MKKKERIQNAKTRIRNSCFNSEQLLCLTIYLLVLSASIFCDKDAACIRTQAMSCHEDSLICLQTLLWAILPWLYTIPGKFIVVPINHSQPGSQQTSNSPQDELTWRRTQAGDEDLHNTLQACCIWWTLVNKGSHVLKRNFWLQQMIWSDQRILYQGGIFC